MVLVVFCFQLCSLISTEFGLDEHISRPVKTYSGGNKRKLSTAVAVLGQPQLILLVGIKLVKLFVDCYLGIIIHV